MCASLSHPSVALAKRLRLLFPSHQLALSRFAGLDSARPDRPRRALCVVKRLWRHGVRSGSDHGAWAPALLRVQGSIPASVEPATVPHAGHWVPALITVTDVDTERGRSRSGTRALFSKLLLSGSSESCPLERGGPRVAPSRPAAGPGRCPGCYGPSLGRSASQRLRRILDPTVSSRTRDQAVCTGRH